MQVSLRGRQILVAMIMGPVIALLLVKLLVWWFKI